MPALARNAKHLVMRKQQTEAWKADRSRRAVASKDLRPATRENSTASSAHADGRLTEINHKLDELACGLQHLQDSIEEVQASLGSSRAMKPQWQATSSSLSASLPTVLPDMHIDLDDEDQVRTSRRDDRSPSGGAASGQNSNSKSVHFHQSYSSETEVDEWEEEWALRPELQALMVSLQHPSQARHSSDERFEQVKLSSHFLQAVTSAGFWHLPLRPDGGCRVIWDIVSMILLLLDSIIVPYQLAFEVPLKGVWLWHAILAVLFWSFDMASGFITGHYDKRHMLVKSFRSIAKRYLRRHFPLDAMVVTCDWLDVALELAGGNLDSFAAVKVVRLLKLGRMVRLGANIRNGKLSQIYTYIFRIAQKHDYADWLSFSMNIVKISFLIVWINHLGACSWHHVGQDGAAKLWYTNISVFRGDDSINVEYGSDDYWVHMYWSVTTMVSGASFMTPTTAGETVYITLFILFSLIFGSTLISSLAAMLMECEMSNREWSKEIQTLRAYLYQNNIGVHLALRVENEIRDDMAREKRLSEADVASLDMLSSKVRAELWVSVYGRTLLKSTFMQAATAMDEFFLNAFCKHVIEREFHPSGVEIFKPDLEAKGAYLIHSGSLEYQLGDHPRRALGLPDETESASGEPGSASVMLAARNMSASTLAGFSGEIGVGEWISEAALWTKWIHRGWMEVVTPSELLTMPWDSFLKVIPGHPEVAWVLIQYGSAVCTMMQEMSEKGFLSDRGKTLAEEDLLHVLPLDCRIRMSTPAYIFLGTHLGWGATLAKDRIMQGIAAQINEGLCDLMTEGEAIEISPMKKGVYRVVSLVALELRSHPGGKLLVQIGDYRRHCWTVRFGFPNVIMAQGEIAKDAVKRLLAQTGLLEPNIIVHETVSSVTDVPATSMAMVTRIHTTWVKATIDEDVLPELRPLETVDQSGEAHIKAKRGLAEWDLEVALRAVTQRSAPNRTGSKSDSFWRRRTHTKSTNNNFDAQRLHDLFDHWETFAVVKGYNRGDEAFAWIQLADFDGYITSSESQEALERWLQERVPAKMADEQLASESLESDSGTATGTVDDDGPIHGLEARTIMHEPNPLERLGA